MFFGLKLQSHGSQTTKQKWIPYVPPPEDNFSCHISQIALTKPLEPNQRVYVKIRTETDEAALAGIDPMMGNDDDETDTKEEFVLCAFIGNAVESTTVNLVLRDYCEFAVETTDPGSEVEAHVTGYYVPEYDEDEEAAMRMYGGGAEDGEEMYDEDDEDEDEDEDFMGFDDEDVEEDFTSSEDEDDLSEEDDSEEEEEALREAGAGGGKKKVTQKGGVVIKELSSDDEDEEASESEEEEEEAKEVPKKRQQQQQAVAPKASKKQKTETKQ